MLGLLLDARVVVRTLVAGRSFAASMFGIVALTVGICTALFNVVGTAVLWALPGVKDPHTIRLLYAGSPSYQAGIGILPSGITGDIQERASGTFDELAVTARDYATIAGESTLAESLGERVSSNYFRLLAPRLTHGRAIRSDGTGPAEIVISHSLWLSRFGRDPGAVGRELELSTPGRSIATTRRYRIVGIADSEFRGVLSLWQRTDYWVSADIRAEDFRCPLAATVPSTYGVVVARLNDAVTDAVAGDRLRSVASGLSAVHNPDGLQDWTLVLRRPDQGVLPFDVDGDLVPGHAALAVAAAAGVLFLVSIVNLIAGYSVRMAKARQGVIVRMLLGGNLWHALRPVVLEIAFIVGAGAVAGVALAGGALEVIERTAPRMFWPASAAVDLSFGMTAATYLFGFGIGLLLFAVVSGFVIAKSVAAGDAGRSATSAGSRYTSTVGELALVPQFAGSVALVGIGAVIGLMAIAPETRSQGYEVEHLAFVNYNLRDSCARRTSVDQRQFEATVLELADAHPRLQASAVSLLLPFERALKQRLRRSDPDDEPREIAIVGLPVSPSYFETVGLPLLAGRRFTSVDDESSAAVAVVSASTADRLWPSGGAIGDTVHLGGLETDAARAVTIVGIVGDVDVPAGDGRPEPTVYVPLLQSDPGSVLLARTIGDPRRALSDLAGIIREAAPTARVVRAGAIADVVNSSRYPRRMAAATIGVVGLCGFLISLMGVYGIVAYNVLLRSKEIAIRRALGGAPVIVTVRLIRRIGAMCALGSFVGAGFAVLGARVFRTYFVDWPEGVFGLAWLVPVFLCLVALGTAYLTASRQSRDAPAHLLRQE